MSSSSSAEGLLRGRPAPIRAHEHLEALHHRQLSPFQRILLTTDGTVTEILRARYREAIRIVKLFQASMVTETGIPNLDWGPGEVTVRRVLLRGVATQRTYIYAESVLVPSRMDPAMRTALQVTEKPIGELMLDMRIESFREILSCGLEPAGEIGEYFGIGADAAVISRTYRVFSRRQPVMLITEKFPEKVLRKSAA